MRVLLIGLVFAAATAHAQPLDPYGRLPPLTEPDFLTRQRQIEQDLEAQRRQMEQQQRQLRNQQRQLEDLRIEQEQQFGLRPYIR